MVKRSREHSSDEFGKQGSGLAGLDAPMIGAAGAIFSDALTERESGVTPSPPAVSVRALAIALVAMFVIGVIGLSLTFAARRHRSDAPPEYRFSYAGDGTGGISGAFESRGANSFILGHGVSMAVSDGRPSREPELTYDPTTTFLVNGRTVDLLGSRKASVTVYDLNGWPVRVDYVRVEGSSHPHATRVEFNVPPSQVRDAIKAH
jgi:hypothetical protein